MQQCTNPEVKACRAEVDSEACREPRQNIVMKEARRKERCKKTHAKALQEWELANPERKQLMVLTVARVS